MKVKLIVASILVLGTAVMSIAATPSNLESQIEALKAQMKAQQAEIQQMRATNGDTWLTERRAEQVKSLVREVLADADTRASLAEGGLTAGHNGRFYLASEDGNFLMNIGGQVQVRYIYNDMQDANRPNAQNSGDDEIEGFNIRRAKVRLDGHLFDPKFTYAVQINASLAGDEDPEDNIGSSHDEDAGVMRLEDAWAAYEFADGWSVKLGQFKGPFLVDEQVNSKYQLAVERAFVTDLFTVDYTQGIQVSYIGELGGIPVRAAAMIHDGSYMANTDSNNDVSDFAIAARGEVLLAGKWSQFDDYTSWSTDELGLKVGAAIDWENSEQGGPGSGTDLYDILKWTVDASVEVPELNGLNATVAVIGQHLDAEFATGGTESSADQFALMLQAGIFIVPDKWDVFVRWEYLDLDGILLFNVDDFGTYQQVLDLNDGEDDKINILTVGTNYYFQKHAAKASLDFMWVMDPMPISDTGAGIDTNDDLDGDDGQFTIRAQFQVLF